MGSTLASLAVLGLLAAAPAAEAGGPLWVQVAQIFGSDTNTNDKFGFAVAIDGSTLIVGAYGKEGGGAAYIFERDPQRPADWREAKKLTPSLQSDTSFGLKVRISGDTIVIGSSADLEKRVAYHFYERDAGGPGAWGRVARFVTERGRNGLALGSRVLASGDVLTDAGVVDLFEREDPEGQDWRYVTTLVASDSSVFFGGTLSVSGEFLLVGDTRDRELGLDAGAAYIFEREQGGIWTEVVKLLASDGDEGDWFGHGLDLDKGTAIVGAERDEDLGGNSGSAYVFERDALGKWMETKKLLASDGDIGDSLGEAVAVSGDVAVAGAVNHDLPEVDSAGAAYVFERHHGGIDNWGEVAKLIASDPERRDVFGDRVDADRNTLVVANSNDEDRGSSAGTVYLFSRTEPLLSVTGSCPGEMALSVIGATPSGQVVLLAAQSEGVTPIPVGPCAGTEVGLDAPKVVLTSTATSGGDLAFTSEVGAGVCGRHLQAVDVDTCTTSNVAQVP